MPNNILFTSKTCKACPQMKKNLEEAGIPYESLDVNTKHGRFLSAQFRVMSLPTLVMFDGDKASSFVGVRPVHELSSLKRLCHQEAVNPEKSGDK
jgi:thioredoxin-like negative regulator of GroEL